MRGSFRLVWLQLVAAALVSSSLYSVPELAQALPWDTDLYRQQSYQPGELARSPVPGTVPLGYRPYTLTVDEAEKVTNPTPFSFDSVSRGRRLYSANCQVCHGRTGDGQTVVGPQVKVVSLLDDLRKSRPDGRVYWVIHNGQGNMPRYGYKFSPAENWDLVNYVRLLQGKELAGTPRP